MASDGPDFGALLRRHRRERHLTQEELATRAGVSPAAVSLLERRLTHAPQRATLQLLSDALKLSADEATAFVQAARRSRHQAPDGASDVSAGQEGAPRSSSSRCDRHLPIPLTPLIGRERDETMLLTLLARPTTRLLTLTGPAGVGKTRLALGLAATLRRDGGQDVVFIGLITVQEPERVLPTVAQALGIRESGTQPLRDTLAESLRERQIVLVLDNFEQVLPAARAVVDLLVACPQVKALVTSRSPLNVRGESCFPVAPLALPDPAQMESLDDLRRVATVALFAERASAAQPEFTLATLEDGRLVAGICARLDGLPLAIELAASRVRSLGLRTLHDRLAQPAVLGMLSEGPQDLADHQRTMRSTIAWSYDLLSEVERRLFRRMSVFVGGATAEAVAAVCYEQGESPALDHLAALVDKSLAQRERVSNSEPRFWLLETINEYAREQLEASGEAEAIRQTHLDYYLALAEAAEPRLKGPDWETWQAQLDADVGNLRAALNWAWAHREPELGLRLAVALVRFWYPFGRPSEGQAWLENLLALEQSLGTSNGRNAQPISVRARALIGAAFLAYWQSDYDRAVALAEAGRAQSQEAGDTHTTAESLRVLGEVASEQGQRDRASALLEESLAIFRALADTWGMAVVLNDLGILATDVGNYARASVVFEECLALNRAVGEKNRIAAALSYLGDVAMYQGDCERAMALHEESLALARVLDTGSLARSLLHLGLTVRERGDVVRAGRVLSESLALHHERGNRGAVAWCLEGLAGVACAQGRPDRAARLYAAAEALREAIGFPLPVGRRGRCDRDVAAIRTALGDVGFASAWAAGRSATPEQVLAAVMAE